MKLQFSRNAVESLEKIDTKNVNQISRKGGESTSLY